jgi:hypothetical protein
MVLLTKEMAEDPNPCLIQRLQAPPAVQRTTELAPTRAAAIQCRLPRTCMALLSAQQVGIGKHGSRFRRHQSDPDSALPLPRHACMDMERARRVVCRTTRTASLPLQLSFARFPRRRLGCGLWPVPVGSNTTSSQAGDHWFTRAGPQRI